LPRLKVPNNRPITGSLFRWETAGRERAPANPQRGSDDHNIVGARMADKDAKSTKDPKAPATAATPKAPTAAAAAAPKKGLNKLILIGAVAAVVVLGGGALAWVLLGNKGDAAHEEHAEHKVDTKKAPVFVDLDIFTVNLHGADSDRFLQVKLVAEVKDQASGEVVKNMMPTVRNQILLLLGGKNVADVSSREGKEKLAEELVVATNKTLEHTAAEHAIEGINFTQMIIQ
jgi:flagellar FliL protein